ncbi:hypothetical protein Afil01_35590 [Actinorhabdospora filicis]|uniref:HEAT repeat domain-containing protein n=1 Tax=Actinorhabdospora filicis TaxID=1785913 RepID=A0A9W6SMZ7_9ACTN|nr:hypothetical protein [Actinorhabdospora filicis]GLZ78752.1 hypothetical protein Afil01_35590 [Actinorhabdospora filicis]
MTWSEPVDASPTGVRSALVRLAVARGRVGQVMGAAIAAGGGYAELEALSLEMIAGADPEIRRVGAWALGQLAVRHGGLDRDRVLTALRRCLLDPVAGDAANEAMGVVLAL